jgi:hypothetical protein
MWRTGCWAPALTLALAPVWVPASAQARGGACKEAAKLAAAACRVDVQDDLLIARATCLNESDSAERRACNGEARAEGKDGKEECKEQLEARRELCDLLGENRYDPDFAPANFVDPADIGTAVAPNPYFPLLPGTEWRYQGGDETVTVTVSSETKLIEGVTCRVVRDVVEQGGLAIEVTDDWYAQDVDGNVWYYGEISEERETFPGDVPENTELVSIDGSWKAGRDGAKAGMLVLAAPAVGKVYREEIALSEAEDAAEVISVTGTESVPAASCSGDCLVTRNFTPLEPGAEEIKYYAPGVGLILEVGGEGARTELVEFVTP